MKAVQLTAHGAPGQFRIAELPNLIAGPGEVVVAVRACGLNHLDLWLEEGNLPIPIQLPRTPGSEVAGQIIQTGPGIGAWKAGDRVAVQSNLFCGQCEFCERGQESLCLRGQLLGVDRDGGFAEQVLVPERSLVRLPDQVSYECSAALTLAGSTAMHMLTDRVEIQPGNWVLVVGGASGVGSAAIQIARGLSARVIATASNDAKKALALKLGAEQVVDPVSEAWPAEVRKLTGKRGVDVVVEHVGGTILEQSLNCLARGGTIVTCGATASRDVQLNLWPLFVKEHRLVGSYGRTRRDLVSTLDWAAAGKLQAVIDRAVGLSETPAAFAALRNRTVLGKAVVVP
ncbi:MAG: zinc-binding dehydrogenase [Verrucomicrobia bacterium]|nr:zinc-binding dehydrogenase [Verrucomicrobiota bacterium]